MSMDSMNSTTKRQTFVLIEESVIDEINEKLSILTELFRSLDTKAKRKVLDTNASAKYINVSAQTLRKRVNEGLITPVNANPNGKNINYDCTIEELDRYLNAE